MRLRVAVVLRCCIVQPLLSVSCAQCLCCDLVPSCAPSAMALCERPSLPAGLRARASKRWRVALWWRLRAPTRSLRSVLMASRFSAAAPFCAVAHSSCHGAKPWRWIVGEPLATAPSHGAIVARCPAALWPLICRVGTVGVCSYNLCNSSIRDAGIGLLLILILLNVFIRFYLCVILCFLLFNFLCVQPLSLPIFLSICY